MFIKMVSIHNFKLQSHFCSITTVGKNILIKDCTQNSKTLNLTITLLWENLEMTLISKLFFCVENLLMDEVENSIFAQKKMLVKVFWNKLEVVPVPGVMLYTHILFMMLIQLLPMVYVIQYVIPIFDLVTNKMKSSAIRSNLERINYQLF